MNIFYDEQDIYGLHEGKWEMGRSNSIFVVNCSYCEDTGLVVISDNFTARDIAGSQDSGTTGLCVGISLRFKFCAIQFHANYSAELIILCKALSLSPSVNNFSNVVAIHCH